MKNKMQFETLATIDVGGVDHRQLIVECCAQDSRITFNDWGLEIMQKTVPLQRRIQVDIVLVKLRIKGGLPVVSKEKTLRPMIEEGFANGLCLCPASVGLEILRQKPQGFLPHEMTLAMNPVLCSGMNPNVFDSEVLLAILDRKREGNYPEGHWMLKQPVVRMICGTAACIDSFSDGGESYLFCRRKAVLTKAGYGKLVPAV